MFCFIAGLIQTLLQSHFGLGILWTTKMISTKTYFPSLLILFGFVILLPLLKSSSTEPPIPVLDVEPDGNCRCPINIAPQISLCGYEMMELNRRAKRKVRQITCEENVVYDCSRRNASSSLIELCPPGTKCSIGSEALSNAHNSLILGDPEHRFCLNKTGLSNISIKPGIWDKSLLLIYKLRYDARQGEWWKALKIQIDDPENLWIPRDQSFGLHNLSNKTFQNP